MGLAYWVVEKLAKGLARGKLSAEFWQNPTEKPATGSWDCRARR
jgi:hypothetical protein